MYKVFARPCGSKLAPTSESYETLNSELIPTNRPRIIFDIIAPNISQYILDPKLNWSAAEAGTFTMTVCEGHPYYSKIQPYKTELLVYEDDTCIWIGRVIDCDIDMYNQVSVTAEGALAYFNDIYVFGSDLNSDFPTRQNLWNMKEVFEEYVIPAVSDTVYDSSHNVDNVKNLNMPSIIVNLDNIGYSTDSLNRAAITLEEGVDYWSIKELLEKCIETNGGYFYVLPTVYTHPTQGEIDGTIVSTLYYKNTYPSYTHIYQAVGGLNITELNSDYSIEDFATAVYPLGARLRNSPTPTYPVTVERYDIHNATTIPTGFSQYTNATNNKLSYIYDATAVSKFGWIEKVCKYDDLTDPDDIAREGAKDLAIFLSQSLTTSITFNALIGNDNAPHMPRLYDGIFIKSPYNGIVYTSPIQILDLEIDISNPWNSTLSVTKTDYRKITKLV